MARADDLRWAPTGRGSDYEQTIDDPEVVEILRRIDSVLGSSAAFEHNIARTEKRRLRRALRAVVVDVLTEENFDGQG